MFNFADLFKNKVVSLTSNPFRRIKVEMGVNYGEDLRKTMEVVMKAVESTEGVLAQPNQPCVTQDLVNIR
ncbi:MAG: hypothetical protein R3B71_00405 [Candidatus Gracilibacteria bacterium]